MQIVSEFGFSPLCISTLGIRNRASVPSSTGINCQPCSTPISAVGCCCNCWRVDWPGFSHSGTNPNAVPTGSATFNLTSPNGSISSQFACLPFSGSKTVCAWQNAGYNGSSGPTSGTTLYAPDIGTLTGVIYPTMQINIFNGAGTDRLSVNYVAQTPYTQMTCTAFTLDFDSIAHTPAGMSGVVAPSTLTLTPIPCS